LRSRKCRAKYYNSENDAGKVRRGGEGGGISQLMLGLVGIEDPVHARCGLARYLSQDYQSLGPPLIEV